jgi:hypothetical protein
MGWLPCDVEPMSLRRLVVMHDAYVVDRWDRTATLAGLLDGLAATVRGLTDKNAKPRSALSFHPYRNTKAASTKIAADNFGALRSLGNALVNQK